jgi:hypothetical protein
MSTYNGQYPYYQGYQAPTGTQYPADGSSWTNSLTQGWFAFSDPGYIKGLVLGAGLTFVLTNPKVQRALVKGAVSLWSSVQGGIEEVKEQIQDIKSEMSMKSDDAES